MKTHEIMKLTHKWIEVERVILSDTAQTQKDNCHTFYLFVDVGFESLDMCISFGIPIEARKLVKRHGGGIQRRRERLQQHTGLKGNNKMGRNI